MNPLAAQMAQWEKAQPKPEPAQKPVVVAKIPERTNREIVAGGDVLWKPVNREAAKLLSKSPWWAQPVYEKKLSNPEPASPPTRDAKGNKRSPRTPAAKLKHKTTMKEVSINAPGQEFQDGGTRICPNGIKVVKVGGQELIDVDSLNAFLCEEAARLPKETRPAVKAAEDARRVIAELTDGIGGDMERFKADSKRYLEDIRSTRFSMVSETSQMTGALKEVRQFFLGGDYKTEIARLQEFVDLCERLQKLKASGFLDTVADTMLRLSIEPTTPSAPE